MKTIFPFVDPVIRDKPPAAAHYYIWGSKVWVASLLKADTRNVVITYLEELSDMVFLLKSVFLSWNSEYKICKNKCIG